MTACRAVVGHLLQLRGEGGVRAVGAGHLHRLYLHLQLGPGEVQRHFGELAEVCAALQDVRSVHLEESSLTLSSVIGLCLSCYFFALCL